MVLNDVVIVKGQGGLGRSLPGADYISGLIFYTASLPSGFSATDRIKPVYQVKDAEDLGILDDYSDETKAAGVYTFTAVGADGDTVELKVQEPVNNVSLGKYTKTSADSSVTLLATAYVAKINAGTLVHGYTATNIAGAVTITARPGLGVFLNSGTPITATIVGTMTGTITTQFTGGVASLLAQFHYHISEYFRIQPQGKLWLGFYAVPGTFTGAEIQTVQVFTGGEVRQFGVYYPNVAFSTAQVTSLQTYAQTLEDDHMPCSVLYGPDISGTALVSSLTTLASLNSPKVSVVIGQDGAALGYSLFKSYSKSVTCLGAALGAASLASVNESIAWVAKFNLSDGTELNVPAFANGQLFKAISTSLETQVNNYRYIYVKSFVGQTGTYFNDSHTCILQSSDYAKLENVRTIDKAVRSIRAAYLPTLNAPILLNANGTLTVPQVASLEAQGNQSIKPMTDAQELSNAKVTVNPTQDIVSTGKLIVAAQLQPTPAANIIQVNIGFVPKIS